MLVIQATSRNISGEPENNFRVVLERKFKVTRQNDAGQFYGGFWIMFIYLHLKWKIENHDMHIIGNPRNDKNQEVLVGILGFYTSTLKLKYD